MSTVIDVTDADFDEIVLQADRPVLVDFWAEWCGPCQKLGPIVDELADEYRDRLLVAKVNADTNPATAAGQQVLGLPTLQLYVGGRMVCELRGAKSKKAIASALAGHL